MCVCMFINKKTAEETSKFLSRHLVPRAGIEPAWK